MKRTLRADWNRYVKLPAFVANRPNACHIYLQLEQQEVETVGCVPRTGFGQYRLFLYTDIFGAQIALGFFLHDLTYYLLHVLVILSGA